MGHPWHWCKTTHWKVNVDAYIFSFSFSSRLDLFFKSWSNICQENETLRRRTTSISEEPMESDDVKILDRLDQEEQLEDDDENDGFWECVFQKCSFTWFFILKCLKCHLFKTNERKESNKLDELTDRPLRSKKCLFCFVYWANFTSRGARHGDVPSGSSVPSGLNVYLKSVRNKFMQPL